jgi:hypothetical protein
MTKEEKKIWQKAYDARPDVKARKLELEHERYRRPEAKERRREYMKAHNQKPEVKARKLAQMNGYYRQPEFRAKKQAYDQIRRQDPEVKQRLRGHYLRREYGLSLEAFDAMLIGQGSVCAICGSSDWGHAKWQVPCVDHDHNTGEVRGIVCHICNVAIGLLRDNPKIARALADYLEAR